MDYTEVQLAGFRADFARRRKNQWIVSIPIGAILLGFIFTQDRGANTIFGLSAPVGGPIVLASVLGVLLYSLRNWRCPACDRYLGRSLNPRFCPHCGVALRA